MREWPRELGRFTCITEHESLDEDIPSFSGSISDYSQSSCLRGSLILDAKYFDGEKMTDQETALGNICKIESDSTSSDNTRYENRYYHTINSLVKHTSPTDTEIQAIDKNGSTPSTPVDIVRTVEFLTPRGNIAKLTYPNFFALEGSSIGEVRAWLTNLSNEWNAIIAKENTTTLSPLDEKINTLIGAGTLPTSPIDWNSLISDEMILQILQAKYALRPDPVEKYKSSIETTLSYSHEYGLGNIKNPPKIPRSNE